MIVHGASNCLVEAFQLQSESNNEESLVEVSEQSLKLQQEKFESFKDISDEKEFENYQDTLINDSDSSDDQDQGDSES